MFTKKYKKILYLFLLAATITAGIKSYAYIKTENGLTGVNIVKPAQESSVNGIAKISAKTFGKSDNVDFIIKNNADGSIKTVKAFFENATNEWIYYLNSMEIVNGDYTIEALAYNGNIEFNDTTKIEVENNNNNPSPVILTKENDKISIAEEKKEPEKIEIKKEEQVITEATAAATEAQAEEKATTTEANSQNQTQILNAVVKALSNIYDTINNNLSASENSGQIAQLPILEGKVAGATDKKIIKKEDLPVKIIKNYTGEESLRENTVPAPPQTQEKEEENNVAKNTEEKDWFKYDLKLSGIENGEKISTEKMLSASCNNPLDSVVFILDNLETPEIDYKFNAVNNYGYYTYWTYKINPKDIKKGEYLLYARGTIDWYNYESPMIIVEVE